MIQRLTELIETKHDVIFFFFNLIEFANHKFPGRNRAFFSEDVIATGFRNCLLVAVGQVVFDDFNIFAL